MPAMDAQGVPASAPMGRGVGEGEPPQISCDRAWRFPYITELDMAVTLSGRHVSCLWRTSEVGEIKEANELESPGLNEGHFNAFQ